MTILEAMRTAIGHYQAGRFNEAEQLFHAILAQQPEDPYALNFLGLVHKQRGQVKEAVALMRRSIANNPPIASLYTNLAGVLLTAGDLKGADEASQQAMEHDSQSAQAYLDRGQARWRMGRHEEAVADFQQSIELDPTRFDSHSTYGLCLMDQGKLDEAIAELQKAAEIDPENAVHRANLGTALLSAHRIDEAIASYRQAIEAVPYEPMYHVSLGMALLTKGDYDAGWPEFDWRLQVPSINPLPRIYIQPRWDGSPLAGKTLLIYHEEGLNDSIQFARFIANVAAGGVTVIVECRADLAVLLTGVTGVAGVVLRGGDALPSFDAHCSLLSLPMRSKINLENLPHQTPYFSIPVARTDRMKKRIEQFAGEAKLRVGLSWSLAGPGVSPERDRLPQLSVLAPLADVQGVRWYGMGPAKVAGQSLNGTELVDLPISFSDFADVAAAIENLDLIITGDSAVAHLAGAMGKETWTLLPYSADWRWLLDREDSPWYPSMRLFRQPAPHDWSTVAAKVADVLRKKVAER